MSKEISLYAETSQVIESLEDTGDYKVFSDDNEGLHLAMDWLREHGNTVLDDIRHSRYELFVELRNDPRFRTKFIEELVLEIGPDEVLGPIDSTSIVNHLEASTEYFCVDLGNECNDHIVGVMFQYFKKENYLKKMAMLIVEEMMSHG